jgi:hypothetical protein
MGSMERKLQYLKFLAGRQALPFHSKGLAEDASSGHDVYSLVAASIVSSHLTSTTLSAIRPVPDTMK